MKFLTTAIVTVLLLTLVMTTKAQGDEFDAFKAGTRTDLLRAADANFARGRVISFDGKTLVWQSVDGDTKRIPVEQLSGIVAVMRPKGGTHSSTVLITPQGEPLPVLHSEIMWADKAVSFRIGKPTPSEATNANGAVGRPNYAGEGSAPGTYVALGHGGELVLEFTDNRLVDIEGPDLAIIEIGPEIEPTEVYISSDGESWIPVGTAEGARSTIDIHKYVKDSAEQFRFVKLIDARAGKSNGSKWPGADIDAVGAIGSVAFARSVICTKGTITTGKKE